MGNKKNFFYDPNVINVTRTYLPSLKKYQNYVKKIFDSYWLTNNGPMVQELEVRLKEFLKVRNIILTCNGTIALQIAYKLLNLEKQVITTPFSFVATTSSLVFEGYIPFFVDIDSKTFNMKIDEIEKLIEISNIKSIVGVHVFGNPIDVDAINKLSEKFNLKIIYDASHCFGVEYNNKSILEYGNISTLSFHATKLFHTIEGGAIVTNDDKLAEQAKLYINFGIKGPEQIEIPGINGKMNEFEAAMGLALLDDINLILEKKAEIYMYYKKKLESYVQFQELNPKMTKYNYSYFPIILKEEKDVLEVIKRLNELNINPRRYFYPSLDTLNYIEPKQFCRTSREIASRILCLPIFPELKKEKQDLIVNVIKSCC